MTLMRRLGLSGVVAACLQLAACTTTSDGKGEKEPLPPPPPITQTMPLDQALRAGVDYGGDTLAAVKTLVKKRNEGVKAAALMQGALEANVQSYEHNQLINAGHLYASQPAPVSVKLFRELLASGRPLARQLGWQLAAVKPSAELKQAIDRELTRALEENDEETVMQPQMANAVRANHLKSAYTIVREGLMTKGDEEYALAMMHLEPERASDDFLPYLALAPAEELRQLTLSSVNLYTAVSILRHMQQTPPSVGAAGFDHLFDYAVSRNTALAELAATVVETYLPMRLDQMAQALARQPAWVQLAYLENARRRMNSKEGLLLTELKKTTAESDVVEEIGEIKF